MSNYSATHQLVYARQVNLNAVGDTQVNVPYARFQVLSVTACNASRTLAASTATLGLYTGPGATGTAIVTPATGTITPLTTSDKVANATLASTDATSGTTITGTPGQQSLYLRVGVADGAAAVCDVAIEVRRLPSL